MLPESLEMLDREVDGGKSGILTSCGVSVAELSSTFLFLTFQVSLYVVIGSWRGGARLGKQKVVRAVVQARL